MALNENLIQKIEFQVQIEKESHFNIITEEIPKAINENLDKYIDRLLEELSSEGHIIMIDQLVLDLGMLNILDLKIDIQEKFKQQFSKQLKELLSTQAISSLSTRETPFFTLSFFAKHGTLPWWFNGEVRAIEVIANQAYLLDSQRFLKFFRFYLGNAVFRSRILSHISEGLMIKILIQEKRMHLITDVSKILKIKDILRQRNRYWSEQKISEVFKNLLLGLFQYKGPIDKFWKFSTALNQVLERVVTGNRVVMPSKIRNLISNEGQQIAMVGDSNSAIFNKQAEMLIQWFEFYLVNGYTHPAIADIPYNFRQFNFLFKRLISNHLDLVVAVIQNLAKNHSIRKRFLESIDQEMLDEFFSLVSPSKKKLLDWVLRVYQQVQNDYKPINQTFISIVKATNEITFELFLSGKLNSIDDQNYIRFLFKRNSRKFSISYKDLLYYTLKSIASKKPGKPQLKFYDVLYSIYRKDILKNSLIVGLQNPFLDSNIAKGRIQEEDLEVKNYIREVFLIRLRKVNPTAYFSAEAWLRANLDSQFIKNTSNFLKLWEDFAFKFGLEPVSLIIPTLVQAYRNRSISNQDFNNWKKKYRLEGIYPTRKPDLTKFLDSLQLYKKTLSKDSIKSILKELNWNGYTKVKEHEQLARLLHSNQPNWIKEYHHWVNTILKDHQLTDKEEVLFNWFSHQLILAPKKNFRLEFFQKKSLEFLSDESHVFFGERNGGQLFQDQINIMVQSNDYQLDESAIGRKSQGNSKKYKKNSIRLFDILGRIKIQEIFPSSSKFADKILFELMLTKYKEAFFSLVSQNQLNQELQDYLLIQAPNWLKTQFLDVFFQGSWTKMRSSLSDFLKQSGWIELSETSLILFIERVLWGQIFEKKEASFSSFLELLLQEALAQDLLSKLFWKELESFRALESQLTTAPLEMELSRFSILQNSDLLTYVSFFERKGDQKSSGFRVLESVFLYYSFPKAHPFEGHPPEDFRSYLDKLINSNRKRLPALLTTSKSAIVLVRFLKLMDKKSLRFLMNDRHLVLGFPTLLQKMDVIIAAYQIKNVTQKMDIWVHWLEFLFLDRPRFIHQTAAYAQFLRLLINLEVLKVESVMLENQWESLRKGLQIDDLEEVLLTEEVVKNILMPSTSASSNSILFTRKVPRDYFELPIEEVNSVFFLALIRQLGKAQSPFEIRTTLVDLEERHLQSLVQFVHRMLKWDNLFITLEKVLNFCKISSHSQKRVFYTAWLIEIFLKKPDAGNLASYFLTVFRILLAEGSLSKARLASLNHELLSQLIFGQASLEASSFKQAIALMSELSKVDSVDSFSSFGRNDWDSLEDLKVFQKEFRNQNLRDIGIEKDLFNRVSSSALLFQILKTMNSYELETLVKVYYQDLGLQTIFQKLKLLQSFFKMEAERTLQPFYISWIEILFLRKISLNDYLAQYVSAVRLLIRFGTFSNQSFDTKTNWGELLDSLALTEQEATFFLQELQGWINLKITSHPEGIRSQNSTFIDRGFLERLLFYPNSLSFKEYAVLVESALKSHFFNRSHHQVIANWIKFSSSYKAKEYLQAIIRIYHFNQLGSISDLGYFKNKLIYTFLKMMMQERRDFGLLFDRLSDNPVLLNGIIFSPLEYLPDYLANRWQSLHMAVSKPLLKDKDSKIQLELEFRLFLTSGMEIISAHQELSSFSLKKLIEELKNRPLEEVLRKGVHEDILEELVKIRSFGEIKEYFVLMKSSFFKSLKGSKFLLAWIDNYFRNLDQVELLKFLKLFSMSFLSGKIEEPQAYHFFIKEFFHLRGASKSFFEVYRLNLSDQENFMKVHSELFLGLNFPVNQTKQVPSTEDAFQWYLDYGFLPEGVSSLKELGKKVMLLKGSARNRLRILIHANLQSKGRFKHFSKFLFYVDESWFLNLIHPQLSNELGYLNKQIKVSFDLDPFVNLGIERRLDRMNFIADLWRQVRLQEKRLEPILLLIFEKWIDLVDSGLLSKVFSEQALNSSLLEKLKFSSSKLKALLMYKPSAAEKNEEVFPVDLEDSVNYGEGISIDNAGLVLFWPFLGRFFTSLGMVDKSGMKSEKIRERSIQLLQVIASGKEVFEECDLVLNKILCGASPDFPVLPRIELTAEEIALCDKLIKGTIYNWEKLRGSSIDTFRETFILREGRLYLKENRWELIVEKKAFDVLLDTLPWNISMINLSWMDTRIIVEWR